MLSIDNIDLEPRYSRFSLDSSLKPSRISEAI